MSYSRLDRLVHRLAFAGLELQKAVADVEDRLYAPSLNDVTERPPVFITSLPRAGTTLLLETIAGLPGYATHTYRDMPFVLCPLLWDRVSRPFRKPGALQARAHGDGMAVGFDSPEAFEEVLWRAFWPDKYADGRIRLWSADDRDPEFEDFFHRHMRKIILRAAQGNGRYVSKNNANIARIPLLRRLFPASPIIVPFRNPLDQAASLLSQHRRFTELHAQDSFARKYMEDIGHLEFGATHRPIAFPVVSAAPPTGLEYWLATWTAAFSHILRLGDAVHLVDFDGLCAAPQESLAALGAVLGDTAALRARAGKFRAANTHAVAPAERASPAGVRAFALHAGLQAKAINAGAGLRTARAGHI